MKIITANRIPLVSKGMLTGILVKKTIRVNSIAGMIHIMTQNLKRMK
jgi:hypothetical protein